MNSFITSTPHKSNLDVFNAKENRTTAGRNYSLAKFSDDDEDAMPKKTKRERRKSQGPKPNETLNVS